MITKPMPIIDEERPRSIRFPQSLWDAIDRDAIRCKRSAVKQMEAVLATYYRLADVELNESALENAQNENHLENIQLVPAEYGGKLNELNNGESKKSGRRTG